MKYDVTIIGGGMSGLISSIYLSSRGFKTALISKGDPVCSISTGCIDMLRSEKNPLDGIEKLPESHPYRRAGREVIKESFLYFKDLMIEAGLPYYGDEEHNRSIYSPIAEIRETCLVPLSMKEADENGKDSLHIISFEGIKDFFPGYFTNKIENSNCSIYEGASKTTIGIATQFDEPQFRSDFLNWLQDLNIKEDKIAIPAVLGTGNPEELMNEIEKRTGKKVFEIPTLPPSIPGFRLFRSLKALAVRKGVDLFWGNEISDFTMESHKINSLIINQPGRPIIVEAKSFILATGSFVSGGLFAEKTSIRETVFNLDVSMIEDRQRLNDSFFDPGHPIGNAGISTTEDYRPIGIDVENLFVGGTILSDCQIMKYNCGHGVALVTGLEAARNCEEYLK